jgi:secreted trypsin-like serine protease
MRTTSVLAALLVLGIAHSCKEITSDSYFPQLLLVPLFLDPIFPFFSNLYAAHASLDTSESTKLTVNAATDHDSSSSSSSHNHRRFLQQQKQPRSLLQSARVVNGWEAENGQFPYAGSLLIDQGCLAPTPNTSRRKLSAAENITASQEQRQASVCASSLIMPRVVVSAGHCLFKCKTSAPVDSLPGEVTNPRTEEISWSGPITVKLNQVDISLPTSSVPGAEERVMSGATRHPDYVYVDSLPLENDISLMWFDNPSQVTPVQIASQSTFDLGQQFMVAGWGYTNPNKASLSDVLLTAQVPYVPLSACSAKYNSPISSGDICAGSDPTTNFADSCAGDSGGPLVMNVTTYMNRTINSRSGGMMCVGCSAQQLVGLTSYGESCANDYPGVYTNVPMHANWIDETITLRNAGGLEKPAIGCTSHVGQRYYGKYNSTLLNIPNAAQCCNACKVNGTNRCRGWTWHKQTKRCILIKKVERRALTNTWTSGNTTG